MTTRKKLLVLAACLVAGIAGGVTWAAFSSQTSSSGNSFSAASSFCTGSALSPFWISGFEAGSASTAGGGIYDDALNAVPDSSTKRSGNYSMRLDASGGSAYTAHTLTSPTVVFRFAIRFNSLPGSNVTSVAGAIPDVGSSLGLGYRASDQKLTLAWTGGGTSAVSKSSISAGNWYVIDLRTRMDTNPRTADWRIDGVEQPSASISEAPSSIAYLGTGTTSSTDQYTAYYDDLIATTNGSDYPIGNGRVLPLRPDGNLTHGNSGAFLNNDGSNINSTSWSRLDDNPMDAVSDYVEQRSNSGSSYLAFGFEDTSETCIRAVSAMVAYTSAGTASNTGKTSIFDGSTERVVYSGDMSESSLHYRSAVLSPAGSSSWTTSAVNALSARVGYASDANPYPRWQSLLLVYEAQRTN